MIKNNILKDCGRILAVQGIWPRADSGGLGVIGSMFHILYFAPFGLNLQIHESKLRSRSNVYHLDRFS